MSIADQPVPRGEIHERWLAAWAAALDAELETWQRNQAWVLAEEWKEILECMKE